MVALCDQHFLKKRLCEWSNDIIAKRAHIADDQAVNTLENAMIYNVKSLFQNNARKRTMCGFDMDPPTKRPSQLRKNTPRKYFITDSHDSSAKKLCSESHSANAMFQGRKKRKADEMAIQTSSEPIEEQEVPAAFWDHVYWRIPSAALQIGSLCDNADVNHC